MSGKLKVAARAADTVRLSKRFRLEMDPTKTSVPLWMPVLSILVAFILCGLFIAMNGMNPLRVYGTMVTGAFGSSYGWTETLVKAIPLLLCGLAFAIVSRINVWNIGMEGQFAAGAIGATAVTIYLPDLPVFWSISLMLIFGILSGALWGVLVAIPKVFFQVNEIITSLMLNYVALLFLDYLVFGPWKDPKGFNFPGSPMFSASQSLPLFGDSRLHLGLLFALGALLIYGITMKYTRWGYELRILGANPEAAKYAGINRTKHIIIVLAISGGLAAIAGMAEVSGVSHRLIYGLSPGYGFMAIIVASLAKNNPFGLLISSVLFGGLIVGGNSVEVMGLPTSISSMFQGAILFCLIAGEMIAKYRLRRSV